MPKIRIAVDTSNEVVMARMHDPEFRAAYRKAILDEIARDDGAPAAVASWIAKNQPFQSRTGSATSSWKAEVERDTVRLTSRMPYTYWLNYGVRPHQMIYLLNAEVRTYTCFGNPYQGRAYIPLVKGWTKGQGKGVAAATVFRRPTEAAMLKGKWKHPGYSGKNFLENAMVEYASQISERHPELIVNVEMDTENAY